VKRHVVPEAALVGRLRNDACVSNNDAPTLIVEPADHLPQVYFLLIV